jgi:hypothetical protein
MDGEGAVADGQGRARARQQSETVRRSRHEGPAHPPVPSRDLLRIDHAPRRRTDTKARRPVDGREPADDVIGVEGDRRPHRDDLARLSEGVRGSSMMYRVPCWTPRVPDVERTGRTPPSAAAGARSGLGAAIADSGIAPTTIRVPSDLSAFEGSRAIESSEPTMVYVRARKVV